MDLVREVLGGEDLQASGMAMRQLATKWPRIIVTYAPTNNKLATEKGGEHRQVLTRDRDGS